MKLMRLIDAEALKEAIKKEFPEMSNWGEHFIPLLIDNAPTVAERPKGEWIVDKITREVVCSCCGQSRRDTRTTHIFFCNHCGADMRGEEK